MVVPHAHMRAFFTHVQILVYDIREKAKHLHSRIKGPGIQSDVVVDGSLIKMHVKCGRLTDARVV